MAEEGAVIEEGLTMNPSIQAEKVEEKARSKGWKPLEEFEGDAADWVEAKEFVGREPLYNKINDLKHTITRQSQKFEQDMRVITDQFTKMSETSYKKALAELKADRALAIKDQDVEAVEALDEQIVDIEKERATAETIKKQQPSPVVTEAPEITAWKTKNAWFEKDQDMTDEAVTMGVGYLAKHQGRKTVAEMLTYVDGKMKTLFPDKFGGKVAKAEVVEGGGGQSRPAPTSKKGKLSRADLSEDELGVMKTFIKRGVLKEIAAKNKRSEEEEYLAQLADAKAR